MNKQLIVTIIVLSSLLAGGPGAIPLAARASAQAASFDVAAIADLPRAAGEAGSAGPAMDDLPPASAEAVTLPAGVSTDWWATVQEDIRRSEYQVTWQEQTCLPDLAAAYQAPNRAQNLRTYFTPEGIRVVRRTEPEPAWEWGLRLSRYGRDAAMQAVAPGELVVAENRIEYRRDELTEWYVNDERGLEQGFTLQEPPPVEAQHAVPLQVELALSGDLVPSLAEGGAAIDFSTAGGVRVLRYGDLRVTDADGRELVAQLEVLAGSPALLRIVVEDAGARYPVTVDPWIAASDWMAQANQSDALFGCSVATAGDISGDGYTDVIIGAPKFDGGASDSGNVYVYAGSPSGLASGATEIWGTQGGAQFGFSVAPAGDVNGNGSDDFIVGAPYYEQGDYTDEGYACVYDFQVRGVPIWQYYGGENNANLGWSVGTAGDVNGDGYDDVIVGAPGVGLGTIRDGKAWVFHGSSSGLLSSPSWEKAGTTAAEFGWSVGTAGDVNGDGYDDVIVGARSDSSDLLPNYGRAYVYHGSSGGLSTVASWRGDAWDGNPPQPECLYYGYSVGTAGDVNGDGYDDVIVGTPTYSGSPFVHDRGKAFVYYGSGGGLSASAGWSVIGEHEHDGLGWSVGTAGDLNGDGYADLIVGAPSYDSSPVLTDTGKVYVYYGSAGGFGATATWTAEGDEAYGYFGRSVATAGDVNGDGDADVIVGAPYYSHPETQEGAAYVFYGPGAPRPLPDWSGESDQAGAQFGFSVATAGDVNGDGYADVIVGAPYFDQGQADEGGAWAYYGSSGGLSTTAGWFKEPDRNNSHYGWSVGTAGDVNRDGYADVLVSAPGWVEGRVWAYYGSAGGLAASPNLTMGPEGCGNGALFGYSVGAAGDVNGDGYSDVIVGAPKYDLSAALTDTGKVYVYHGGFAGLIPVPLWSVEGDQGGAQFGYSVGTAGDVNGDGYSDVIAGAPYYDGGQTDEGGAWAYYGSLDGLSTTAGWFKECNLANAHYGHSVATAGDVNGDGYSDVLVGVPGWSGWSFELPSQGRVWAYYGSAGGLGDPSAWTPLGDQEGAQFGYSVSTAGDVNGDGYADVIVGAPYYDRRQPDEGQALLWYGSGSGLSGEADWTAESNQAGALLGWSVGTAGDVNGDGYSDLIIGAPCYDHGTGQANEGIALVYHGSAGDPSASAMWGAQGDQAGAKLGLSVATAGDVNGDGYADVVVGASGYDSGEADKGKAFVYHGSQNGLGATANWTVLGSQGLAQLGYSVGTAGDVNGDGYADVVIGAPFYDGGQTDEGAASVYYGSPSGLGVTPKWTAESDQGGAQFGYSVGTAGDVNGDGYADVVIGAPYYDGGQTDEGVAFVYYGSPSGLGVTPRWTAEGDQGGARLGCSVGTAGDVNGDGYGDVIVGASGYDNGQADEGAAFVYYGSGDGLSAGAAWTTEANQAYACLGWSVGTAGDVNGDGYADVIVGVPYYDKGQTDEGVVWAYYGSSGGLSTTANWSRESNGIGAQFGFSVGTAGDVNGDGYADVVVGAPGYDGGPTDEGVAFAYYGSPSGLGVTPKWTAEGNQRFARLGWSVGTAGDVNGDGYADLLVGEPGRNSEAGAFDLYYGDGSRGLSLAPRQLLADRTGPIAYLGVAQGTAFRVALRGRTPFGRGKVKLQWEVKPLGSPFNGSGLGTSPAWLDTGTAGPAFEALIDSLSWDRAYHWRVRLLYHPASTPFQQRSRWLTQPWNGWQEARVRTGESADLSLSKADAPDPVPAGEELTYTLTVRNSPASQMAANWVLVTDTLPAGASFVGAGGTGWDCVQGGGVVTCTLPTLAVGAAAPPITISVDAPAVAGVITNTARVSASSLDPNPADNTASAQTQVTPAADLWLGKGDDPDPVRAYGSLTYTLSVSNAGPSEAEGMVVTDALPAGVTFVDADGGASWACTEDGAVVTCTWSGGPLPVGAAPPITLSLKAPTVAGVITNTAWVSTTTADLEPVNNAGEAQTTVVPNRPPLVPLNSFPPDGSEDQSTELMLCWSGSDPDGDDLTYDVYFGISPTLALVSSDQYGSTYAPGSLLPHVTYVWKIVARDQWGAETEGPVWSFSTGSNAFCHQVTVVPEPAGMGTVSVDPAPNCGGDYLPGTSLVLEAVPADVSYRFKEWSGDAAGSEPVITVTIDGPKLITATFAVNQPPLVPLNSFPPDKAVGQSTELMLCWSGGDPDGDPVTYDVYFGISPTLTLVSSDQYATTYTPGVLAPHTTYTWKIVARDDRGAETEGPVWSFATGSGSFCHPLTTGVTPALGGVVTASPGPNCSSDYLPGTVVTLTAAANAGYAFTGWSGDASGTAVTVTVLMDGPKVITATFEASTAPGVPADPLPADLASCVPLTQTLSWSGSDPDGDDLTYDVYFGISPTLGLVTEDLSQASYDPGGLASGQTYVWQVVARDEHGAQTPGPVWSFDTTAGYTLEVEVSPPEGGSVSVEPMPDCGLGYLPGTVVTLTATASPGYVFTGWGGDASGTVLTTTVTMAGDRSVVANFELEQVGKWLYLPLVLRNY